MRRTAVPPETAFAGNDAGGQIWTRVPFSTLTCMFMTFPQLCEKWHKIIRFPVRSVCTPSNIQEPQLRAMPYIPVCGFALQGKPLRTEFQETAMIRKIMLAALLAGSIGSIATPASAVIYVRIAPPEPRVEVVPQPRRGYVWAAGHWEWRNRRHVWVAGNWIRERRGFHYAQPAWRERDGRWYMERGNWRRGDRDGDGVPDRQDRAPNNPKRN